MENYTPHPQEEPKKVKKKHLENFKSIGWIVIKENRIILFLIIHLNNTNWHKKNKAALPLRRKIMPIIHMGLL